MSLNRSEQRIDDYLKRSKDERHYWISKVQTICRSEPEFVKAVARIENELWRYYVERSSVVPEFKEVARREGLARISMQNLAELMVRLWTEPRKKPKASEQQDSLDLI